MSSGTSEALASQVNGDLFIYCSSTVELSPGFPPHDFSRSLKYLLPDLTHSLCQAAQSVIGTQELTPAQI